MPPDPAEAIAEQLLFAVVEDLWEIDVLRFVSRHYLLSDLNGLTFEEVAGDVLDRLHSAKITLEF